jgi:hypothetical protein
MSARFSLALILAVSSGAQSSSTVASWQRIQQAVHQKETTVRLRDGNVLRGTATASDGALMLDSRSIACAEIAAVEVKKKSRKALWTVLGGAAGLAAGAALATRFSNEGNDGAAVGLAAGLAAAGAGIGYAAGGKGKGQTLTLSQDACTPER